MTNTTKQIEAYNLAEFCKLAQDAMQEGFKFDFDNNANYPTSFGSFFSAVLTRQVKAASDITTLATSAVQQVQQQTAELVQDITETVLQTVENAAVSATEVAQDATTSRQGRKKAV